MKTLTRYIVFSLIAASLCWGQVKPACSKPVPPTPPTTPTPPSTPVTTTTTNNNNSINNNSSSTSSSNSNSSSNSSSSSASNSSATGGSATATGGSATANGGAGGNGGSGGSASASNGNQSNSQTSVTNQNQVRQAPALNGGFIVPTGSCLGAVQGGVSAPVGGFTFGKSSKDKECNFVRLANEFIAIGKFDTAAKVLCASKTAQEAHLTADDCLALVTPAPAPVVQAPPAPAPAPEKPTVILYQTIEVTPTPAERIAAKALSKPRAKPVPPVTNRRKCTVEVPCESLEK
jgi:hypothetical protein